MSNNEKEKYVNCKSLDDILDIEYGARGTEERERFETAAEACLLPMLFQCLGKTKGYQENHPPSLPQDEIHQRRHIGDTHRPITVDIVCIVHVA